MFRGLPTMRTSCVQLQGQYIQSFGEILVSSYALSRVAATKTPEWHQPRYTDAKSIACPIHRSRLTLGRALRVPQVAYAVSFKNDRSLLFYYSLRRRSWSIQFCSAQVSICPLRALLCCFETRRSGFILLYQIQILKHCNCD